MKKRLALICLLALIFSLWACMDDTNSVTFVNQTEDTIDSIYISPSDQDQWGQSVNITTVSAGKSVRISMDSFLTQGAEQYDLGCLNVNNFIYETYNLTPKAGDIITLTPEAVTITSGGSTQSWQVFSYSLDELEQ